MTDETKKRKFRKDHKFKFTKDELRQQINEALMWTSDGVEAKIGDRDPVPFIMGDVENLTIILTLALTEGLPAEEDATSASAALPIAASDSLYHRHCLTAPDPSSSVVAVWQPVI